MDRIFKFLCSDFLTITLTDGIKYKGIPSLFKEEKARGLKVLMYTPDKDKGLIEKKVSYINRYSYYDVYTVDGRRYLEVKIKDITFDNHMVIETQKGEERILSIFSIDALQNTGKITKDRRNSIPIYLEISVNSLGELKTLTGHLVGVKCIKGQGAKLTVVEKGGEEREFHISPSDILEIKKKRG